MTFRAFSMIMFGMSMLGFAIGVVVGVYLQIYSGSHAWAYIAVPFMGLGSGVAAYGTLRAKKERASSEGEHG